MIQASWKRLMSGTAELQDATDNLANVLSGADPTALEGDPDEQIEENENEKEKLIKERTVFRQENNKEIKDMREGLNESEETQPVRESRVQ